jgi:DNA-binding GntR family transcriptional regulator
VTGGLTSSEAFATLGNAHGHHMGVSLADEAYAAIRDEILRGMLRPGAPLSRRRLAEKLGMSVLPVSDALRRLEEDGLVESRPRAGTRVKIPSGDEVRELYELREALESQTARLFAERGTPAERRDLRRRAGQLDVLFARLDVTRDDPALHFAVNGEHVRFHLYIADRARSRLLKQIIDRKHVLILNWLFDVTGRRSALPPGFHTALAEALTGSTPDAADAAMRGHVRYGLAEISGRIGALAASEWRERRPKRINPVSK